jgi:hypothetical protein
MEYQDFIKVGDLIIDLTAVQYIRPDGEEVIFYKDGSVEIARTFATLEDAELEIFYGHDGSGS